MARKRYALRTPPRPIRSSGEEALETAGPSTADPKKAPSAVHDFESTQINDSKQSHMSHQQAVADQVIQSVIHPEMSTVKHHDTIMDDEAIDAHELREEGYQNANQLLGDEDAQLKTKYLNPNVARIMGTRSQMSNAEWKKVAHHHAAIPDPAIRHAVNLERDEVEEALELKHEKMTVRLASLKTSAKKADQVRETKVKREMNEGLRPLVEERFESNRWLDRLLIEQLETSDNGLHQRSQDESDEIAKEAENLRVRHEMGDMLGEDVRTEYRQLRKRQARAKEVVRREPFRRDRATLNVMDDYTTGTRRPEESSDPRRIMGVYHEFNEMLAALLPLLDVEKEELPRAMVTASEHLTEMLELADRVELYSDDPIFKVIKRKEISDLIYALEAGGRAKVVQGELMEKSDLGGWDQVKVDDGTGAPVSAMEAILGIDADIVRDRIVRFSMQVLASSATGPTDNLEFRDLNFPNR